MLLHLLNSCLTLIRFYSYNKSPYVEAMGIQVVLMGCRYPIAINVGVFLLVVAI